MKPFSKISLLFLIASLPALVACSAVETQLDNGVRSSASRVINTVVTDRFPNANPAPITKCAVDNATRGELLDLARAGVTGFDGATVQTVLNIVARPETVKCLLQSQINLS